MSATGSATTVSDLGNFQTWMQQYSNDKHPHGPPLEDLLSLAIQLCLQSERASDDGGISNITGGSVFLYANLHSRLILSVASSSQNGGNTNDDETNNQCSDQFVTWQGIHQDWFANVFLALPEVKQLMSFGCPMWFLRCAGILVILYGRTNGGLPKGGAPATASLEDLLFLPSPSDGETARQQPTKNATTFISFTGSYTIEQFTSLINSSPELAESSSYLWIDTFCVNQFAWTQRKDDKMKAFKRGFMEELKQQVCNIQATALLLPKWDELAALKQIWVIWEIFSTVEGGAELSLVIHPEERARFEDSVINNREGINALYKTLGDTKVQNAQAAVESDQTMILNHVESTVGCAVLNNRVNEVLRGWIQNVLSELVEARDKTNGEGYALFCNEIGVIFNYNGVHDKAMEMHQKALAIQESVHGRDHPLPATTYHNMGGVLDAKGDYDGAMAMYEQALAIREAILGKNHIDTADTYINMGSVLNSKGNYDEALVLYKKALEIRESVLGKDHPDVAQSYNNIGNLLDTKGDYDQALVVFKKALEVDETVHGQNHPSTATAYNNIAGVLENMGDCDQALEMYERALTIRESVLGKGHPGTATTYNNIAFVLGNKGDNDRSLAMHEKALAIWERVYGKDHPSTATTYNNIAFVLKGKGDYDQALAMYEKALAIRESMHGENHPDIAVSCNNIAGVMYRKGDFDGALSMFKKALSILEVVFGKDHPYTKGCLQSIEVVEDKIRSGD